MKIKAISGNIVDLAVDAIVVNLFEGTKSPGGATGAVDKALDGVISRLITRGQIKGKLGEITSIHTLGRIAPEMVLVAGLGKQKDLNEDVVRQTMAAACKAARNSEARQIATILHGAGAGGIPPDDSAQAIVEGSMLGNYSFREHLTKKPEHREIKDLLIVEQTRSKLPRLKAAIKRGRATSEAAMLARDMVNQPANLMTPTDMAKKASEIASHYGLGIEVLEREDMQRLGMGALLGVAQGSEQPPKFIILTYKGNEDSSKALGLIGKGLTFDSGGISIKPSEKMDEMKGDMAGGASVIATLQALGELKPKINVTGLIPATENMPSGAALKPGDVVKAMNGTTIEVVNTDAEGRLILADALCYGNTLGLSPMIDIATLTGACHIALGDICSGAFGNNQKIMNHVIRAGSKAGENMWQMPMFNEYKERNRSAIADIKNSGGRWGGAITAAQFLATFAGDTPWVHLDIAGTYWLDSERGYLPKGATGIPVRTLINMVLALA